MKSVLLYGDLSEQVFIDQPPSYVKVGSEHNIYKLKKTLYRLKQIPCVWYSCIDAYFSKERFKKYPYEHMLFIKIGDGGKLLTICLLLLIFTRNDSVTYEKFKKSMMTEFDICDLEKMHYFLSIEVVQFAVGILVSQRKCVQEILNRIQMKNYNPISTPVEVGLKLIKESEGKRIDNTLYR